MEEGFAELGGEKGAVEDATSAMDVSIKKKYSVYFFSKTPLVVLFSDSASSKSEKRLLETPL